MYKGKKVDFYVINPANIQEFTNNKKLNNDERLLTACLSDEVISESQENPFPWPHNKPVNVIDILRVGPNKAIIVFEKDYDQEEVENAYLINEGVI